MSKRQNKNDSDAVPASLGQYIRQAREKRGISARRLSHELKMHASYISRLEADASQHPSPEKLQRLATFLDLNYDDLFAMAGYRVPEQLPSLVPYLRAKYNMSDKDALSVNEYFAWLKAKNGITEKQSPTADTDLDYNQRTVSWTEL